MRCGIPTGLGKMEMAGDFGKSALRTWRSLKPTEVGCGLCMEQLKKNQQQECTASHKRFAGERNGIADGGRCVTKGEM